MEALPSCNFNTSNFMTRWPCSAEIRIQYFQMIGHTSGMNTCYCFWGRKSQREISRTFNRFTFYSSKSGGSRGGREMREGINLTMVSHEEDKSVPGPEHGSENTESQSPNISKRLPLSATATVSGKSRSQNLQLMDLLGSRRVDLTDVKLIKEKLFSYSTFWVVREEKFGVFGEGILFIGNLRANREVVFAKLRSTLAEFMGDKYDLFMVEEPNSKIQDPRGGPRVSFGLLPKRISNPGPLTVWHYAMAFTLFLLTIGSSVELALVTQINSFPPEVQKYLVDASAIEPSNMELLLFPFLESGLPVACGILGVQLFHEAAHNLAATWRRAKLGIPYFLPNVPLGCLGAITQFKSTLPDRRTKVDISLAGPLAGAILSLLMLFTGLLLSSRSDASTDLVQVPSVLLHGSLLLGLISRSTLGHASMQANTVSIHPLVIAGWCGFTTSAFNLLPVGCLDGGRAMQGAFGNIALLGSSLTTYLLLATGLIGGPLSFPWMFFVLLFQGNPEKPCLNDVTEVGSWRKAITLGSVTIAILTLLPLWDEIAAALGMGI